MPYTVISGDDIMIKWQGEYHRIDSSDPHLQGYLDMMERMPMDELERDDVDRESAPAPVISPEPALDASERELLATPPPPPPPLPPAITNEGANVSSEAKSPPKEIMMQDITGNRVQQLPKDLLAPTFPVSVYAEDALNCPGLSTTPVEEPKTDGGVTTAPVSPVLPSMEKEYVQLADQMKSMQGVLEKTHQSILDQRVYYTDTLTDLTQQLAASRAQMRESEETRVEMKTAMLQILANEKTMLSNLHILEAEAKVARTALALLQKKTAAEKRATTDKRTVAKRQVIFQQKAKMEKFEIEAARKVAKLQEQLQLAQDERNQASLKVQAAKGEIDVLDGEVQAASAPKT